MTPQNINNITDLVQGIAILIIIYRQYKILKQLNKTTDTVIKLMEVQIDHFGKENEVVAHATKMMKEANGRLKAEQLKSEHDKRTV